MGECFRGGDRNVRQFYLMPIKTARDIPTTNRADSNGYLDERTTVQLCLKVLPAGTLSLKSPCQLPVDALRVSMAAGHLYGVPFVSKPQKLRSKLNIIDIY